MPGQAFLIARRRALLDGGVGGGGGGGGGNTTLPAPQRTVNVSTYAGLVAALEDPLTTAGTHIVLANGTYSGSRIPVPKSGAVGNPIVIRSANLLGANVPGTFQIAGQRVILHGLRFVTTGEASTLQLDGGNNSVWRCEFKSLGGNFIVVGAGLYNNVRYCEFSSQNASDSMQPSNSCVRLGRHVEVGHCYFHDLPAKPPGQPYSTRARNIILAGGTGNSQALNSFNWHVHHCLAVNTGNCRFSINSCDNVLEYVTIIGKTGSTVTYSTDTSIRFGSRNIIRGCWYENADSILVWDRDNKIISCKGVSATAGMLSRADNPNQGGLQYAQTRGTLLVANEMPFTLGGNSWAGSLPVLNTRVENHQSTLSYGLHTGTVEVGTMTETPVTPIKLTPAMVGPLADL